jgi:hypothetical protein
MKPNLKWLSLSLSCEANHWNLLLNKGIKGCIQNIEKDKILTYQFHLSQLQKSTINFFILASQEHEESLINKINGYFKEKFLSIQSPEYGTIAHFSLNTSDYGLHKVINEDDLPHSRYNLQKELSDIMIEALSDEIMNDETLLTFAFYLHVELFKVLINYCPYEIENLLDAYQLNFNNIIDRKIDIMSLQKYYTDNKSLLESIVTEIYKKGDEPGDEIPIWLNKWSDACGNFIKRETSKENYSGAKLKENIINIQKELLPLINQHLAIAETFEMLLFYLVSRTLGSYYKNRVDVFDMFNKTLCNLKLDHFNRVKQTKAVCKKIDKNSIPKGETEIRLFVIARNESLRLPYFLKYYSRLGVDRFFFIDNNSTDNTREIALLHKNTHVFKIDESYKDHWNWMEFFLDKYGKNKWCIVVDVDELLYFPYSEIVSLKQLTSYLESNRYNALRSLLLDVYSDKAITDSFYKSNQNPLKICQFFDHQFFIENVKLFDKRRWKFFDSRSYFGGVRKRVFMNNDDSGYGSNLTKISLFKYFNNIYLFQGMHGINGANIADIEGTVMHTKFLHDFKIRVNEESIREEHFNNAMEYKVYNNSMQINEKLTLKYEGSIKYKNTQQLVYLGIMKSSDDYQSFLDKIAIKRD